MASYAMAQITVSPHYRLGHLNARAEKSRDPCRTIERAGSAKSEYEIATAAASLSAALVAQPAGNIQY
jgi:hypothetical protein